MGLAGEGLQHSSMSFVRVLGACKVGSLRFIELSVISSER